MATLSEHSTSSVTADALAPWAQGREAEPFEPGTPQASSGLPPRRQDRPGWLYEMHCHTGEFGWCAHVPAAQLVHDYIQAGYDGIGITNHYTQVHFDAMPEQDWAGKIDRYLAGYYAAKEAAGSQIDIRLGIELRFPGSNNDYLVYGLDRDFLLAFPRLYEMGIEAFSKFALEHDLYFGQAHPFRDGCTLASPRYIQGIEVFNGSPPIEGNHNELSLAMGYSHPWIQTAGSDYHNLGDVARAGVYLARRPHSDRSYGLELRQGLIVGYYRYDCPITLLDPRPQFLAAQTEDRISEAENR